MILYQNSSKGFKCTCCYCGSTTTASFSQKGYDGTTRYYGYDRNRKMTGYAPIKSWEGISRYSDK